MLKRCVLVFNHLLEHRLVLVLTGYLFSKLECNMSTWGILLNNDALVQWCLSLRNCFRQNTYFLGAIGCLMFSVCSTSCFNLFAVMAILQTDFPLVWAIYLEFHKYYKDADCKILQYGALLIVCNSWQVFFEEVGLLQHWDSLGSPWGVTDVVHELPMKSLWSLMFFTWVVVVVVLSWNLVTGLLIVLLCCMSLTIAKYLYALYFFHESFWIRCEISFFSASLPRVKYLKTLHFVWQSLFVYLCPERITVKEAYCDLLLAQLVWTWAKKLDKHDIPAK